MFIFETKQFNSQTIAGNKGASFNMTLSKTGYKPFCFIGFNCASLNAVAVTVEIRENRAYMAIRNVSSSPITIQPQIDILWVKSS